MAPEPPSTVAWMVLYCCCWWAAMSGSGEATWCVARSEASDAALQRALDYACGAGADCIPLQSDGLCFLPNTLLAHASYAFNSYYQRRAMAPGSCDFSGTANVAKTDPSYGSCVYPSSLSTAGGLVNPGGGGGIVTQGGGGTASGTPTTTSPTTIIYPPPTGTTISKPGDRFGGGNLGSPDSGGAQDMLAVGSFLFLLVHIM
ncbi:hypothetical protein DM860_001465 [Cuscuta australis]|uniref:X8 domain-containing protein n=1 Tax=Cuscuta australis TaxID=267555 RepID=A0A328E8X8_9ASTE|nr:hypothetical protein DM860_001465 [Cuscuta australis]